MKKPVTGSKIVLMAAIAVSFAMPALAHNHMDDERKPDDRHMHCDCTITDNTHVDTIKGTVAPHTNIKGFMATGQLPVRDNYWKNRVEPGDGQQKMMAEHLEMPRPMKDVPPHVRKEMKHKKMEKRREHIQDMKSMSPEDRAAAKVRWEQRKKEWDAMTPEQKAAIKAKRDAGKVEYNGQ